MTTGESYAKALYALIKKNPEKASLYAKNLKTALRRRGHEKLLPQIAAEGEKLRLREERSMQSSTETPEREQNRILFELYRKLTA
ncbi:hypothetical protein H7X87_02230 [Acetobacteraceae bacterium]|nr:hypothetical protein [Candidatus Parcubacteria bacterium]